MNTLTSHRKPIFKYGHAQLANSAWMPRGGWYQHEDGSWRRIYARRSLRAFTARRAVVERKEGWWKWRVEVFELDTRATRRICARGVNGYPTLAHTDAIVERYAEAVDQVFGELAQALAQDDVLSRLRGPVAHSGFKRLL